MNNDTLWLVLILAAVPLFNVAILLIAALVHLVTGGSIKTALVAYEPEYPPPPRIHAANFFHRNGCECDGCTGIDSAMMERYYRDLYYDPAKLSRAELQDKISGLMDACADTLSCEPDGSSDCCSMHRQLHHLKALEAPKNP